MVEFLPSETPAMRVAILCHSHPSLTKGGAEIAAYSLFRGLREIGIDAIFIGYCPEDERDRLALDDNEFPIFYDPSGYDHFYHIASGRSRAELLEILIAQDVTLLNAHHFLNIGIGLFEDAGRAGIPTVFTIHEFLAICHNHGQMIKRPQNLLCDRSGPTPCNACFPEFRRQQFALRERSFAQALDGVSAFVSPSHFLAERYIAWGLPAEKMSVIENGIVLHAQNETPRRPVAQRVWKYGFFGQINPFKGIDTILGACAILARTEGVADWLRIIVHGNFVGQNAEFIDRFHAALATYPFLTYAGPYDNTGVGRLMGACDYIVAPSSWWENSPVVIQEAFQAHRPVICTGIGGMAEKVVDGVTGLHFARNDAADLASRIVEGADEALHETLKANLPPVYDPTAMARSYMAVFEGILVPTEVG